LSLPGQELRHHPRGRRVRLFANGQNEGGKGIWMIRGTNVVIDGIELQDAAVPDGGTLTLERCEFARNCSFHEAKIGHNFKSRAKETRIENCYFMDGPSGAASYLLDVPDGGVVCLRGNLLQKGRNADNSISVHFGEEYLTSWPVDTLTLIHNPFVSTLAGGTFVTGDGRLTAVTSPANLFGSITGTAAKITAPDNVAAPNFWPLSTLLPQTLLSTVPDPSFTFDAPTPYAQRSIGGTTRRVGALQASP
jgi:hypothetical protein